MSEYRRVSLQSSGVIDENIPAGGEGGRSRPAAPGNAEPFVTAGRF